MKKFIQRIKLFKSFCSLYNKPLNLVLFTLILSCLKNVDTKLDYDKNKRELVLYQLQQLVDGLEKGDVDECVKQSLINKVTEYIRHNSLGWNNKNNNICI